MEAIFPSRLLKVLTEKDHAYTHTREKDAEDNHRDFTFLLRPMISSPCPTSRNNKSPTQEKIIIARA